MLFSDSHILSTILFTPIVGGIFMLFIPRERAELHRWMGNIFAFLGLAASLPLSLALQLGTRGAAVPIRRRPQLDPFGWRALHRRHRRL